MHLVLQYLGWELTSVGKGFGLGPLLGFRV